MVPKILQWWFWPFRPRKTWSAEKIRRWGTRATPGGKSYSSGKKLAHVLRVTQQALFYRLHCSFYIQLLNRTKKPPNLFVDLILRKKRLAIKISLMSILKISFEGLKSNIIFSIFSRAVIEINLRLININQFRY